jgi:hypothetical protein
MDVITDEEAGSAAGRVNHNTNVRNTIYMIWFIKSIDDKNRNDVLCEMITYSARAGQKGSSSAAPPPWRPATSFNEGSCCRSRPHHTSSSMDRARSLGGRRDEIGKQLSKGEGCGGGESELATSEAAALYIYMQ